jgi:hypothetical protein
VAAALLVRLGYVFLATDYPAHLVSDMRGYWERAHFHLAGVPTGSREWALWPPFYHVVLAGLFRFVETLGVGSVHWLGATLGFHAVLGALAAGAVHVLAHGVLRRPAMADGVAILYAVTYPIVYLEAFVLSENVAIPTLAAATTGVAVSRFGSAGLAAGGALLGAAIAARPGLAVLVPAFLGYVCLARSGSPRRAGPLLAFAGALALVIGGVSLGNVRLSDGMLRGIGRNGGVNFFITQCRVHRVDTIFAEGDRTVSYRIVHPQFALETWRTWVATDQPPYAEGYYYRRGVDCWRERPITLVANLPELRKLVWGPFFPSVPRARGFTTLDPVFAVLIAGATVVALVAPIAWRGRPRPAPELWLLWSLLVLTFLGAYLYGAERRFLLPVVFAAYVCAASVVMPSRTAPGGVELPVAA